MVRYPGLQSPSVALGFSEEGPHVSPSGRVSSISCHRSHTAWRVTPRALAISAQDRPAFRAYFTLMSSVWSHVWRTCWIAFKVATTSAVQLCGLDLDNPVDRGPFIALWTVSPPLYLAITSGCPCDGALSRHLYNEVPMRLPDRRTHVFHAWLEDPAQPVCGAPSVGPPSGPCRPGLHGSPAPKFIDVTDDSHLVPSANLCRLEGTMRQIPPRHGSFNVTP